MTLAQLLAHWHWDPIANCPGRFKLQVGLVAADPSAYFGLAQCARSFASTAARDPVLVLAGSDFGLISYRQTDGRFLHTLNTPSGFHRKLRALGIDPETVNAPKVLSDT